MNKERSLNNGLEDAERVSRNLSCHQQFSANTARLGSGATSSSGQANNTLYDGFFTTCKSGIVKRQAKQHSSSIKKIFIAALSWFDASDVIVVYH